MYDLRHTISTFSTVYNMYHLSQPDNSTLKNIGYISITIYICLRMRQKKQLSQPTELNCFQEKRMHIKPRLLYHTTNHVLLVKKNSLCSCRLQMWSTCTYMYTVVSHVLIQSTDTAGLSQNPVS